MAPLDFLLDGGGFANPSFERVFIETTLVTATAAPSFAGGGFFIGWEMDGEMTPDLAIAVTVVAAHTIKAVYTRPGDFDLDDDVDLSDFANLRDCFTGPVLPSDPGPGWQECLYVFDSDADGDVDLSDFAIFQANCTVQY